MKRRKFIKVAGLGSGSLLFSNAIISSLASCSNADNATNSDTEIGVPVTVVPGNFTRLLPIPAVIGTTATLTAQATTATINGTAVSVYGYQANGLLGPTIKANNGSSIAMTLQNNLSQPTNIHWHGIKTPANMDGYPTVVANSNGNFNYQFTLNQRAGLYWYHPHTDGLTAQQVFKGLAGLFIVNDSEEQALNLPSGAYEIPLVIQDKRIGGNSIGYNPNMSEVMSGYMGESVLVNGEVSPYTNVESRYYRLRILNGSNARVYNLGLSNNANFIIIGNDAGLIATPTTVQSVMMGPGERLDVLINFGGMAVGSSVYLENKLFSGAGAAQGVQDFPIMKFVVSQQVSDSFVVPLTLSSITAINPNTAVKTRTFDISNSGMNMSAGAMQHTINNKTFDSTRIDETVAANTNEIWVFDNTQGSEPHPMHIHAVQYQVLQRIGGRNQLIPSESGWKDTVLVMPGEMVKVLVPFENYTGKFVFHCHNLEHEDSGMMLQYQLS